MYRNRSVMEEHEIEVVEGEINQMDRKYWEILMKRKVRETAERR